MIEQNKIANRIKFRDNIAYCMTELNRQKMQKREYDNFYNEEKILDLINKIKKVMGCSLLTASNVLKSRIKIGVIKA
jgi:hypothetical protein